MAVQQSEQKPDQITDYSWKDAIVEVSKATAVAIIGAVTMIGVIMLFVHFVWGI